MLSLTVGITSYDNIDFLIEAVKSVTNQKLNNKNNVKLKILIGHDNPKKKLYYKDLKNKKNRKEIKIINHKRNLGEIKNLNFLLKECQTEWFCWLADDDIWHPLFLSSILKAFKNLEKNKIAGIYTKYEYGPEVKNFKKEKIGNFKQIILQKEKFIDWYINNPKHIIGCYGIMKTSFLKKRGYPKLGNSFSPYSDDLIPLILAKHGEIHVINQKLLFLRTHKGSLSANSTDIVEYNSAQRDFLRLFFNNFNPINHKKNNYYKYKLLIKFIYDDFNTLMRNKNLSLIKMFSNYFQIQNKKRKMLSKFYQMNFYIYLIYLPIRIIIVKIIRKYLKRI